MAVLRDVRGLESTRPARVHPRRRIRALLWLVAAADLVVIATAVVIAWDLRANLDIWLTAGDDGSALSAVAGPWIGAFWLVVLAAQGAYSARLFGAGPEEFKVVTLGSLLAAGSIGMFCYLIQLDLSRGFLLLTFFVGLPLLLGERYLARKTLHLLRVRGRLHHRVVAVGGPTAVREIVAILDRERYVGYRVVGACVPEEIDLAEGDLPVPHLGAVPDTARVCAEVSADTVLVAGGGYSSLNDLRRIAWDLEDHEIELVVVPSLTDIAGPRIHMRPVAGLPLLHVERPQAGEATGWDKRAFDVAASLAALVVLAPVMLAVAVLIKLYDGGPVFFRQARIGRDGAAFPMLKFRSMVVDAEERLEKLRHLNESDGTLFKIRRDPRITPVGRWLRKYSLDELPQLFNVLRGDMSLVGPRPPLPGEVDGYAADTRRRLLVRPGMTGLWQVSGRSELSWKESVRLDLYYVDNWSMVSDLVIMAKTVRAVLASEGAY